MRSSKVLKKIAVARLSQRLAAVFEKVVVLLSLSRDKTVRTNAASNRAKIARNIAAFAIANPGAWFAVSLTPNRIAARSKART